MTFEELKQKLNDAILNLGITPSFTENPAFHRIIENIFYPLLERLESGKKIEPQIITDEKVFAIKDSYTVYSLGTVIDKRVSLRLNKEKDSSFSCLVEILKGIPESTARKIKEVVRVDVKMDYEGNIYTNEIYSYANETAKDDMLEGSAVCTKTAYDNTGIMVKKDKKAYNGLGYNTSINRITNNELLYIPNKAFDIQSNVSLQYDQRETMIREAFDVAEIHSSGQATTNDNIRYVLLDETKTLADMTPATDINGEEVVDIDSLTEEEINEKINQESDPQVRNGLFKYAKYRNQYKYHNGIKEEILISSKIRM